MEDFAAGRPVVVSPLCRDASASSPRPHAQGGRLDAREMGKRISMDLLRDFLEQHAHEMPRTTLRYAIEKMSEGERKKWMGK